MSAFDLSPVQISFQPRKAKAQTRANGRWLSVAVTALPVIGGIVAIGAFLYVALTRVSYPYELEWLESGMLEHVNRLANGDSIYSQPGVDFTQLPYGPLTFGIGAVLTSVVGDSFWVLRSVSLLSIIAVFALLYSMVKSETKNAVAAFTATGLFAATYAIAGFWFDVAKPDSLFVALTLGAIAVARHAKTAKVGIAAALLMTLAVLAKQTAIFALVPVALYLLVTRPRAGVAYVATIAVALGGITFALNAITDGWYNFFVWELLFQHDIVDEWKVRFFTEDLRPLIPIGILILAAAPKLLKRDRLWSTGFYAMAIGGLVAGAFSSRLHSGGTLNVLMPAFAGAALAAGIAFGVILEKSKRSLLAVVATAIVLTQFVNLRYDPTVQIPTNEDRAASDQFVAWLKTVPGDVWVVDHPAYNIFAGKQTFAGEGGIEDIMRGTSTTAQRALQTSIANAIHQQHFSAIILDGPQDDRAFPADWKNYYEQMSGSAIPSGLSRPIVNDTGVPTQVWVPVGTTVVMPDQLFTEIG